jgi:F420H(2)-dependent quinone reductase
MIMNGWIKFFTAINTFVFQKTNGRLGNQMGKQAVLLLQTTGRKSGKTYTTPLSYFRDGSTYLVVASNWGQEDHPNWFYNLQNQAHTTIQVGATSIPVDAHSAEGEEYNRLWNLVTRQNSLYLKYQQGTARKIPIVVLTPTNLS